MSRKIRIVAGVALAAVGVSLAAAQKTSAVPSSKQVDPAGYVFEVWLTLDGAGIPNRHVSLTGPDAEGEATIEATDASGCARFYGLRAGEYSVDMGAWHAGAAHVPASRRLRIINTSCSDCVSAPIAAALEIETTISSFDDRIPLAPAPVLSIAPPLPSPRRNPIARFFAAVGHKLGL
jgi:hypothetical protein